MYPRYHFKTNILPKSEPIQLDFTGIGPADPVVADVLIRDAVTLFLFEPITPRAREWFKKSVGPGAERFVDAVVVEHRYAEDLARGMMADRLQLEIWREPVAMPDDIPSQEAVDRPAKGVANETAFDWLKALSILTEIPSERFERFVRGTFPEFKVGPPPDPTENLILDLLPRLGYSASPENTFVFRRRKPPSLAAMLGSLRPHAGLAYLIVEADTGRCIAAKRWKLYDTHCPEGITRKKYPYRRIKIGAVWSISIKKPKRQPMEQCRLPFPGESKVRRVRPSSWWRSYLGRSSL